MGDTGDVAALATTIGFIRLHRARKHGGKGCFGERVADAMAHKPRSLVTDLQRPVQLVGRDPVLVGAHEMEHEQPLGKRNLAALEDGPDQRGELLPALPYRRGGGAVRQLCVDFEGVLLCQPGN